ncbi:MAG: sulfite exporter TauE/SafE family protein [Pseudomonadota bacterium]|nr:sulfite exporter TauE/SafE family protein [Pseudomonadota bacterium]
MPLLVYCNVPIHQAVGTSAACGLPIAVAGAIGFVVADWGEVGLPAGSSGYVLATVAAVVAGSAFPAPLGARLAHALPVATLRRGFAAVVALIGPGWWCSGLDPGAWPGTRLSNPASG